LSKGLLSMGSPASLGCQYSDYSKILRDYNKNPAKLEVCLEQAKAGFAWHYRKYEHEQSPEDRKLYADDEALNLPRSSIKTSCSQQTGATLSFQG
jgi:hypothetical protein